MLFSLKTEQIEPQRLQRELENAASGAFVCFQGWVRDHHNGRSVEKLEYQAHPVLAEAEGNRILQQAMSQHEVIRILAEHRTGTLAIGDMAVWVGVVSAHRAAAFSACSFVIDEIKQRVPIWKKEYYLDGDIVWVNAAG